MNEKKNIDRLFQEKFKDFEVAPNDAVWDRINESIPNKKKKRRVIPIWWQIGGVAATVALLLTIGVSVFNSDSDTTTNPTIVDIENKDGSRNNKSNDSSSENKQNELNEDSNRTNLELVNSENKSETSVNDDKTDNGVLEKEKTSDELTSTNKYRSNSEAVANTANKDKIPLSPKGKRPIKTKSDEATLATNTKNKTSNEGVIDNKDIKSLTKGDLRNTTNAVTESSNNSETNTDNSDTSNSKSNDTNQTEKATELVDNLEKESIENAIAAQENNNEEEKEDEQNRWSIKPNVAPVYFASLSEGSSIDSQFNDNAKGSDINMSYGITGSYAISNKLKVRAGINRVNLNHITSDVLAFSGSALRSSTNNGGQGNIKFKQGAVVSLISPTVLNSATTPEIFNTKISGDLEQRFGFIEVPLELEYRLLDKKFGVNVIGGFSTFFLNENEIYADIDGTTTLIGEANNINSTSFSANFGLGLDYSLSKQWNINLEPQFKYQINTFNNTSGNFRPFFIGVYTGLSFKF